MMHMWWGYLHKNGTIQLKPWFGDHKDYTTDCKDNEFVVKVCPPFYAGNKDLAIRLLRAKLDEYPLKK